MATYRTRQTTVEAVQFTGQNASEVINVLGHWGLSYVPLGGSDSQTGRLFVQTFFGGATFVEAGDWIVRSTVPGRFFLSKPDTFAATYELVEPTDPELESEIRALLADAREVISNVRCNRYSGYVYQDTRKGDPDGVGERHDSGTDGPDAEPEGGAGEVAAGSDPGEGQETRKKACGCCASD